MKLIFMGTPEFAVPTLDALLNSQHSVLSVVTAPDKPSGRGLKLKPSPVKAFAIENHLTVLQPEKLKEQAFIRQLHQFAADVYVVVGFRILPPAVFTIPPKGTINLHASLLPRYRGAAPISWAIMKGETKTGATVFFIDEKVDTGKLIIQDSIPIHDEDDAGTLHDRLMHMGASLVLKAVNMIADNTVRQREQTGTITLAPKINREHCQIDWSKDTATIYNQIRGLSPYPAAFSLLGGKVFKIFKSKALHALPEANAACGEICEVDRKAGLIRVVAADGYIDILELQLEGRRRMTSEEFLRGHDLQQHQRFQ
ncbi:methionyl-tRNA formyltransferase [candidate division KSB1 bacterium]|nr:methionyl-tRNA formyltransferase [candidate division KSB1 bacterium]